METREETHVVETTAPPKAGAGLRILAVILAAVTQHQFVAWFRRANARAAA